MLRGMAERQAVRVGSLIGAERGAGKREADRPVGEGKNTWESKAGG